MVSAFEVNFDGLVGPTHNYGGLSFGNVASTTHRAAVANPREAALQGLRKMRYLADLGLKQAVLPPQERPDLATLRRLGLQGTDAEVLRQASARSKELLAACSSASTMWTANAATVSPSADSLDGKVHFTPANLTSKFHRSIEPEQTGRTLKAIFADPSCFAHHEHLPPGDWFGDEGAANHTRLCESHGAPGLEVFVFGRTAFAPGSPAPVHFPARQTREASEAVARLHRLRETHQVFLQQNPVAIDAGVFHNDVAAVGNLHVFFCHELAFLERERSLEQLRKSFHALTGRDLIVIEVRTSEVSLPETVKSYLFNSQIISLPSGGMALIAPLESQEIPSVRKRLEQLIEDETNPIRQIQTFDLRQSMRNGGGPACLRLRVVLTERELALSNPKVHMNERLFVELSDWVTKNYRDRLAADDLRDPRLLVESRTALDSLTQILGLGSIYPFQQG